MAVAKLMAMLGLDAGQFKAGIDGAKSKTASFQSNLKSLGAAMRGAFMLYGVDRAINKFLDSLQAIKEYTKETGIKLIPDEEEKRLDKAAEAIEKIQIGLKAIIARGIGGAISGIQMLSALIGGLAGGMNLTDAARLAVKQQEEPTEKAKIEKQKKALEEKKALDKEWLDFQQKGEEDSLAKEQERYDAGIKANQKALEEKKKDEEDYLNYMADVEAEVMALQIERENKAKEKALETAKKEQEIREKFSKAIEEEKAPRFREVGVSPSSAARMGMYMGEKDRSDVAVKSHQLAVQFRIANLNQLMLEELKRIGEEN